MNHTCTTCAAVRLPRRRRCSRVGAKDRRLRITAEGDDRQGSAFSIEPLEALDERKQSGFPVGIADGAQPNSRDLRASLISLSYMTRAMRTRQS